MQSRSTITAHRHWWDFLQPALDAASILAASVGDRDTSAPRRPHPAPPTLGWTRTWLVLALVHVAASATLTLVLFPQWRLEGTIIASWLAVTAAQAGAARGVSRIERWALASR